MAQGWGTGLKELTRKRIVSFAAAYTRKGIKGLTDAITEDLDAWRNTDINIALVGESGAGKSTLINAIRGLDGDSPGAAPTGTIETTTEITLYKHPLNPKLLLIDLPGVGTKYFPKETYKQKIDFQMFDLFIIVSEKRFSQNDIWLAEEIEKVKKKLYFVRTKFGSVLKKEQRKRKKKLTSAEKEQVKQTIRDDIEVNLKQVNRKKNLFIIDSFAREQFDFPDLEEMLKNDTVKIEAMIFTLQAVTEQAIKEKKKILESRIWQTALLAAFAPRANDADIVILKKEKEFYLAQFNLKEYSFLRHDAEMAITKEDEKLEQCYEDELVKLFPFLPIGNHIKKYRLGTQFLQDSLNSVVERAMEVNSMEVNRKQIQQDSLNSVVERAMEVNPMEVNRKQIQQDSLNSVVERAMEVNPMEVNRKQIQQDSLNSVVERAMEVNPMEDNRKLASDIAEKCTDLDWYLLHVLVGKR